MKRLRGVVVAAILIGVFSSYTVVLARQNFREKIKENVRQRIKERRNRRGKEKDNNMTLISGVAPESYKKSPYKAGDYERRISVDGRKRKYLIHVPSRYQRREPTPVILNFHGGGGNAERQRLMTKMDEKSDSEGFIVVYPDGTGKGSKHRTFNVGPGYGYAWKNKIDDIHFVEVLLDDLARFFHVDAKRTYSTGHSNGAMMSYRLASDLPDRIAAIAPVGATVPTNWLFFKRPTSILHFHGLEDRQYPFAGGMGKRLYRDKDLYEFTPVMDTLNWYIRNNNCPAQPAKTYKKGKAVCQIYGPGDKGAEVILWTMEEAGHTWPGGSHVSKQAGKVSFDINANDLMWEFFKKHPLE